MEVDVARKRIGLSMRLDATAASSGNSGGRAFGSAPRDEKFNPRLMKSNEPAAPNAMMSAFAKLKR
jgi:protein Tex